MFRTLAPCGEDAIGRCAAVNGVSPPHRDRRLGPRASSGCGRLCWYNGQTIKSGLSWTRRHHQNCAVLKLGSVSRRLTNVSTQYDLGKPRIFSAKKLRINSRLTGASRAIKTSRRYRST